MKFPVCGSTIWFVTRVVDAMMAHVQSLGLQIHQYVDD